MKLNLPARRLIPRWRRVRSSLAIAEGVTSRSSKKVPQFFEPDDLGRAVSDWRRYPTTGTLGEILSYSIFPSLSKNMREFAGEFRGDEAYVTQSQSRLLSSLRGDEVRIPELEAGSALCNPYVRAEMQSTRAQLHIQPANPLLLLDYAQMQLAAGQRREAERSIASALSLAPNNRLVLRTASRYYVHLDQHDRALKLLGGHARTPADPWLMASEIAVSSALSRTGKFASKGLRFLKERSATDAHLCELAGALGGLELRHGHAKRGRDLYRQALLAPNDNVVAQAVTDSGQLSFDAQGLWRNSKQHSAEVQTILAWDGLDERRAEVGALEWYAEESFSSRPLTFLTTLYAVNRRYEDAIAFCRRGLIADPGSPGLLANLSYSLACYGTATEAEAALAKLRSVGGERYAPVVLATTGLLAMKAGRFADGDALYKQAIDVFADKKEMRARATCLAYMARSAVDWSHPEGDRIVVDAIDAYKKAPAPDAAMLLREMHRDFVEADEEVEAKRRLTQWVYDVETNTIVKREIVTSPGAPPLLIKKL